MPSACLKIDAVTTHPALACGETPLSDRLTLTTRELENIDPGNPRFVGKRLLQDYFGSGDFEHDANVKLSAADTHVFLCGNPELVGNTRRNREHLSDTARSHGMIDVLERRGFWLDRPNSPGNIHIEKYW